VPDGLGRSVTEVCGGVIAKTRGGVLPVIDVEQAAIDLGLRDEDVPDFVATVVLRLLGEGYVSIGGYRNEFQPWDCSPAEAVCRLRRSYVGPLDVDWGYSIWLSR